MEQRQSCKVSVGHLLILRLTLNVDESKSIARIIISLIIISLYQNWTDTNYVKGSCTTIILKDLKVLKIKR
jgi:hypothetical protein